MPQLYPKTTKRDGGLLFLAFLCWIFSSQSPPVGASGGIAAASTIRTYKVPKLNGDDYTDHLPPQDVRCPTGCQCVGTVERRVSVVRCINAGLTAFPADEQWLPAVLTLVVVGNNISALGAASPLASARDLETIVLSRNGIVSVDSTAFQGQSRLKLLDLSGNRLQSLPPPTSLYATLSSLRSLNLSGNTLVDIPEDSFAPLTRLASLDLANNALCHLVPNTFHGLETLLQLNLTGNNVTTIEVGAFSGLRSLDYLSLNRNSLVAIEANAFYGMSTLRYLVLANNLIASLSPRAFEGLSRLSNLDLSGNQLTFLPPLFTRPVPELRFLDLSLNPLRLFNQSQLSPGTNLEEINLSHVPQLAAVLPGAFADLSNLRQLNLSGNPALILVAPNAFPGCISLEVLDLSGGGLETLHGGVFHKLTKLRRLHLGRNRWRCDCGLQWLPRAFHGDSDIFVDAKDVACASGAATGAFDDATFRQRNCSVPAVTHHSANVSFRVGSAALLECQAVGDPTPLVTWLTPSSHVLHWYPETELDARATEIWRVDHPLYHDERGDALPSPPRGRLRVLRNGNLLISPVDTSDAGSYVCLVDNALGNSSAVVFMTLDYDMLMHAKVVSILAGLALSVAFLLTMLMFQLVLAVINRWGCGCCCCCPGALPPKARHIRKMLESVEHYKSQQLDRLRDNYNVQVNRIKDNCTQQMEKLRDSYAGQTERLRDIRDFGTQQIDRLRDQYYEQVRKVRDYSTQQMSRVRENYVSQRNRIRKFSAHQLFKLRENYKMQQLHLNKILETLNLESCRNVCARTDSTVFAGDNGFGGAMGGVPGLRGLQPLCLDGVSGTPSESDSLGTVEDFDGNIVCMDPFDLPPLPPHHPLYLAPLELPPIPEVDDPLCTVLDMPPPSYLAALGYEGSTSSSEGLHAGGMVELAEVVTYIVNPSNSSRPPTRMSLPNEEDGNGCGNSVNV